jgi:hypothetical protein
MGIANVVILLDALFAMAEKEYPNVRKTSISLLHLLAFLFPLALSFLRSLALSTEENSFLTFFSYKFYDETKETPLTSSHQTTIHDYRKQIRAILAGKRKRNER